MTREVLERQGASTKRHKKPNNMQKSRPLSTYAFISGNGTPDFGSPLVICRVIFMEQIPYLQAKVAFSEPNRLIELATTANSMH